MTTRCPTCARPFDEDTVTGRLLALLARAELPVPSAQIARELGVQKTTIYQTTARLADRGSIRRSIIQGSSGWILTPQASQVGSAETAEQRLARLVIETRENVIDFVYDMPNGVGQESMAAACRGDLTEEVYEQHVIQALIDAGRIRRTEGGVILNGQA